MAKALYYPPANRTAQWFGDDYTGSLIDPDKVVWHTTETGGWPGYGGGASAPTLTYHAEVHDWRQHFPANRSSRALRNESGGVQTNTEDALQVEIIAYSDERLAAQRGHLAVSDLDSQALDDLADFAEWAHREWGVPLKVDPGWVRSNYQAEHGMSFTAWRAFAGHTGHNRVPENTHWDPARLDIDEIMRRARTPVAPAPTPEPEKEIPVQVVLRLGRSRYRTTFGDQWVAISEAFAKNLEAAGIPIVGVPDEDATNLAAILVSEG